MDAAALLAPLASEPRLCAVILDVDGTLAPIARRPELAEVPAETKAELHRLVTLYGLVACISGRAGAEAAALVGVEGIRYVGNHGLELDPRAPALAESVARFRDSVAGLWPIEDKALSLSFHYREAPDEPAAVAVLEDVAERARLAELDARWGRKVLEVRPRAAADKGVAVTALLTACGARAALYAGDDATDADAFRGLVEAGLDHAVRIAVSSPEAPPTLLAAADVIVAGPSGLLELLRML